MKKVFLDTNVLLDFVLGREGMQDALAIFQLQEDSKVYLSTSILSMANVAYVAKKGRTKIELYELMQGLSEMIHTLQMDEVQLQEALSVIAPDFEDMLQMICAKTHDCDAIITRNKKDFTLSILPVYTPEEFLHIPYYWTNSSTPTILNEQEVKYEKLVKMVEDEMDKLWEQGLWNQEKNEEILKEHLRTPYVNQ